MRKSKILIITGVLAMFGLLSGCSFGWKTSYGYENGDKYVAGDREISEKIEYIEIDYLSGNVTFSEGESDKITITETSSKELDDDRKVHTWVDGSNLYVRYCASAEKLDLNRLGKKLFVEIPKDTKLEKLYLKISSGNIDATCSANYIELKTSSGNVTLTQKGESDNISAKTSSGNVNLKVEKSDTVIASVSSGNITADINEVRELTTKTSSGNTIITLPNVPENSDISGSSGNITVYLPKDAQFNATMKTSSGKVSYDQALTKDGNHYTAGSSTNEMKIHTSSGNINLKTISE